MNRKLLLSATALRTVGAFAIVAAYASQAEAQEAPADTEQDQSATNKSEEQAPAVGATEVELQSNTTSNTGNEVVVTGSRIRRPNLESTVPITSIGGESLIKSGDTNIGDQLNELPQLRSTFAQQNPGLGVGVAGLNLLDLRGLGTVRTLVLVNGRRHVAADILNNAVSPDVNSIPNDLIERVDIVTGGNSAIYGSDAIAGVVNFVLKRDFEGLQIRGQAGGSTRGFGDNQYVSAMYGHNFADGRANVTVHGEFVNEDRIFGSELPWLRSVNGLVVTDVDGSFCTGSNAATCDPNVNVSSSDGIPDSTFLRDIRSATINRFGLIPITQRSTGGTPACGLGLSSGAPGNANRALAYNCNLIFDEAGNLSQQTGTRIGQGTTGSFLGGNGQTGREGEILSIMPEMQRYNFNALGHYTVSDAFEPFFEAKWNRVDARGSNAGPSFIQGARTQFDTRERIRLDNPFLTPAQRSQIASAIVASGCNTDLTVACATASAPTQGLLSPTDLANIANGSYRFVVARQLLDAGIRDEDFRRDTYRVVLGARGTFNDDWSYEWSFNYGKFKETTTTFGYLDRQRFMLSLDAADEGLVLNNVPNGHIVCRSQVDPAAKIAFPNNGGNVARLDADVAACVPYNPFGGKDNSAAVDYFSYNATNKASLSQFVASGFMSGDSSEWFELPGGPVRFALGGEWRVEEAKYINDPFIVAGNTNAVNVGIFDPAPFEVKEAFGEFQVPIVKDVPVFHELTLSGAARVAGYGGKVGTVWAYNAGLDWAPVRDIRFRGNYSRAVRAPNLSETGFPVVENFAPGFVDPCSSGSIANNPNRTVNCQTDVGSNLATIRPGSYSLPIRSGSNPDLKAETSDSYTFGAVIQPRFIPGMALSVDYYDITVKNVIVSLSAQTIVNSCYDQPTLDNVFCTLFERYTGPDPGPLGTHPGEVLANSLLSAGINFASRKREGLDINIAYRRNVEGFALVNTNLILTHNFKNSNYENPALPDFENRILEELGDPKDEFRWDTDLTRGIFTLGYRMRYIGKMYTSLYENFNSLPDNCHMVNQNCAPLNEDVTQPRKYPAVFYHDIRGEVNLKDVFNTVEDLNLYVGIDNVLDKHPPLGLAGTGTTGVTDRGTGNAAIYDALGRRWYAGFRAQF